MSRARATAIVLCTALAATALFGAAGYFGGNRFIDSQNQSQLRELTALVLARAERQADFAFIALGDLVQNGEAGCSQQALGQMRRQVYLRSTVKDIRVVDGSGRPLCAAFPETLSYDADVVDLSDASAARNSQVSLFRLDQRSTAALGVLWRVEPDLALVAVLNTDALLFDVLPMDLRSASELELALPTGAVATFSSLQEEAVGATAGNAVFEAASGRYPLVARLTVDGMALRSWNKGPETYVLAGASGLGLVFGLLLGRLLAPRRTFVTEIDEALAAGEFKPFAQPVFALETGAITGCEILARWVRQDGTIISPYRFIGIAEESGRIVPMTRTLIRQALGELAPILARDTAFTVAFNVSPRHFLSPGFLDEASRLVAEAGVAPGQVVLEITERQDLQDLDRGSQLIVELADRGIRVAIDDAGTGHNGLSQIQKLGAQILKIDKFFVDAIELDFSARVIIEMLVKAARELKMTTVAEGIEREQQLVWLRDIGVDEGQGFLVSPPVPIVEFVALVRTRPNALAARAWSGGVEQVA